MLLLLLWFGSLLCFILFVWLVFVFLGFFSASFDLFFALFSQRKDLEVGWV